MNVVIILFTLLLGALYLNEIRKTYCYNTIFIENVNELNIKDVKGFKSVGIMAGASTPKDIIDEVYNKLIEE